MFAKCYAVVNMALGFDEANSYCQENYGGSLVSFYSRQEEEAVLDAFDFNTDWIGLRTDAQGDGEYYWIDGTPVAYSNFLPGYPNDMNGTALCVLVQVGKFKTI